MCGDRLLKVITIEPSQQSSTFPFLKCREIGSRVPPFRPKKSMSYWAPDIRSSDAWRFSGLGSLAARVADRNFITNLPAVSPGVPLGLGEGDSANTRNVAIITAAQVVKIANVLKVRGFIPAVGRQSALWSSKIGSACFNIEGDRVMVETMLFSYKRSHPSRNLRSRITLPLKRCFSFRKISALAIRSSS